MERKLIQRSIFFFSLSLVSFVNAVHDVEYADSKDS